MILGLFETHFAVADLDRACRFYGETLGLELGRLDRERRVAFYWVGSRGQSKLGVWEKPAEQISPQHDTFRASIDDVLTRAVPYLHKRDLEPHNFLNDGDEQPMVFGWMLVLTIHFRDPDGHSLEFIAMLPDARPLASRSRTRRSWTMASKQREQRVPTSAGSAGRRRARAAGHAAASATAARHGRASAGR
jgi:catechol 2,3-dioxygenase-like lactoylglutathione lyase family enzyme